MNHQLKLFYWQNNGNCLVIVARGLINRDSFLRLMDEVVDLTRPLNPCKILIDVQDTTCDLGLDELVDLKCALASFPWTDGSNLKLALVTPRHQEQFGLLRLLRLPNSALGVDVGVFYEEKRANDWLVEETNDRVF